VFSKNEWARNRYATDPDYRRKRLAHNRAYKAAHKAAILARQRRRRADPAYRERHRVHRYGLSLEDYKAISARQDGACAICRKKSGRILCIDHCHSTGKVRGLLCSKCNSGLGFFQDNSRLLQAAMDYMAAFARVKNAKQNVITGAKRRKSPLAVAAKSAMAKLGTMKRRSRVNPGSVAPK
jgi:hypothetical protein